MNDGAVTERRSATVAAVRSGARWRAVAVSVGLAMLCLRGLFQPGLLLQVDVAVGTRPAPLTWDFSSPLQIVLAALIRALGGEAAGRIYAVTALAAVPLVTMLVLRHLHWWAQLLGGAVSVLNPWIHDRMADGQWGVVLAAAGVVGAVPLADRLATAPTRRVAIELGVCIGVTAACSVNLVGPEVVVVAFALIGRRATGGSWRALGSTAAVSALLMLPGLLGFLVGGGPHGYGVVERAGRADFTVFATSSPLGGSLLSALTGLYGYWAEPLGRFADPAGGTSWWPLTSALVAVCTGIAAWLLPAWRWLAAAGVAGLLVAATTALPGGVDAASWLAAHLPIIGAYREPQKWSVLWLAACAILVPMAADGLAARGRDLGWTGRWRTGPLLAAAMAAGITAPAGAVMVARLTATVQPVALTAPWSEVTRVANGRPAGEPLAVLPWHRFLSLSLTGGRLVGNPAQSLVDPPLVQSSDAEIPGTYPDPASDAIGTAARVPPGPGCQLSTALDARGIHWALVEDARSGGETVSALTICGWHLVAGSPALPALLAR